MTTPELVARRILIVDDDAGVRRLLRRLLTAAGYEVQEATDGHVALEAYARQPSDVVITDIVMPGKEGLETIRELRRRAANVRIIAMSAGGDSGRGLHDYLKMAKLLGAVQILPKPFSRDDLLDAVANALAGNK
jgi:CheY-like chemotaxis protein